MDLKVPNLFSFPTVAINSSANIAKVA